jgi:hypothetical protein
MQWPTKADLQKYDTRFETTVGFVGWFFAIGYLLLATVFTFPAEHVYQRFLVVGFVALALYSSWSMMRYVGRATSRVAASAIQSTVEIGVITLFLLGIATSYAFAYSQLGILYTSPVDELRNSGIDWINHKPVFSTDLNDTIYFSLITLATVGYGDFRPSPEAREIAALEGLNGVIVLGIILAYFSSRVSRTRP